MMPRPRLCLLSLSLVACGGLSTEAGISSTLQCDKDTPWFRDADGDGHGDPTEELRGCLAPEGYVSTRDDCDDTNARFHPDATEDDCDDPSDYNCDGSVGYEDADADGFSACDDCADDNPLVNEDATEVCDGVDNDCDAITDNNAVGAPEWFIDYDHDGFGSSSYSISWCEQPAGYVDNALDCDDTSAMALPGGIEVCDGLDNNCDGSTDGVDAADAFPVYPDSDADGFGADVGGMLVCELPSGFIELNGDCQDTDPTIHPEAIEICADGIDNDCDGGFLGCEQVLEDGAGRLLGVDANDRAGIWLDPAGDVDGDGIGDIVVGAYQADVGSAGTEGAAYVLFGPLSLGDTVLDAAEVQISGVVGGSRTGFRAAGVGDLDGDGLDDVVVTASLASEQANSAGSAYLFSGASIDAAAGTDGEILVSEADHRWSGGSALDWVGVSLIGMSDVDGDGLSDLAIGATGVDLGGAYAGAVYLLSGETGIMDGRASLVSAAATATFYGESTQDYLGADLAAPGDLDGDGTPELVLGSYLSNANGVQAGSVYIASAASSGLVAAADVEAVLRGSLAGDRAGSGFVGAGDLDGDGLPDLWVGASRDDDGGADAGAIFLVPGNTSLSALNGQGLGAVSTVKVIGAESGDGIGGPIESLDFDGDGSMDLVFGSRTAGLNGEGRAWVMYGPLSGTVDSATSAGAMLQADSPSDHAGAMVRSLGDAFGTGQPVLGVTAWEDDANGTDAGAVYLMLAPSL